MAHGIYTKRDFQVAETMGWHNLTRLATPQREHFPEIMAMPLFYNGGTEAAYGDNIYVIPVAKDDGLPVAPPYCKGTYTLFQPREAWDWVHDVLAGTGFKVQSIGMLWNRSVWFMSTELTELRALTIGDGRETRFQFNFSGGLDRKTSPQCELSSTVMVCHNTMSISRQSGKVLFHERLTSGFNDRLKAAKSEIENAVGMAAVFKAAMDGLAKNPCNVPRAERIFAGYVTPEGEDKMASRTKNTVAELTRLHRSGKGNKGESEFDALNAYTQLYTHGKDDAKTSMGRRFASSEFGTAADSKADFCRILTSGGKALEEIEERGERLVTVSVD